MINEQSQKKRETKANQIACPECGHAGKKKLVQYQVNAEGLIPCMCLACGERWYKEFPNETNGYAGSPVYQFQCNRCFIISGHLSRNQNDAPACCGGEIMTAIEIILP